MTFSATPREQGIYTWLSTVVDENTPVIIANKQKNQRYPDSPFVMFNILTEELIWQDRFLGDEDEVSGEYGLDIHQHYSGTLSVQAFGNGCKEVLNRVLASIEVPSIRELNQQSYLCIDHPIGATSNTSTGVGSIYDQRASQDFYFVYGNKETIGTIPVIDEVHVETGVDSVTNEIIVEVGE